LDILGGSTTKKNKPFHAPICAFFTEVYRPEMFLKKLPRDYYFQMRPIVEKQLEKVGIRLTRVLEDVLGR
jgi:hypothetical protein